MTVESDKDSMDLEDLSGARCKERNAMIYKDNKNLRWSALKEITEIVDECGTPLAKLPESEWQFHRDHLLESSLGRIWQYATDPNISFGMISPYLTDGPGKLSEPENRERVPQMATEIRDAGYGYVVLNGFWVNDKNEKVRERSFLVMTKKDPEKLFAFLDKLRKKYGQTAFAWKQAGEEDVYGVTAEGKIKYGKFNPDKLGFAYSQIAKGSHAGRNFVFESLYNQVDSFGAKSVQESLFRQMKA